MWGSEDLATALFAAAAAALFVLIVYLAARGSEKFYGFGPHLSGPATGELGAPWETPVVGPGCGPTFGPANSLAYSPACRPKYGFAC
jgi:hypothetical protein